jgi:hypothetical protein
MSVEDRAVIPGQLIQHGEEEAAAYLWLEVWGQDTRCFAHQNSPLGKLIKTGQTTLASLQKEAL